MVFAILAFRKKRWLRNQHHQKAQRNAAAVFFFADRRDVISDLNYLKSPVCVECPASEPQQGRDIFPHSYE